MNAPSSPWSGPKISHLWSARGDERCSPPRSDDYKDWSLAQLKREITQRQLKTNPRRRNKDAFVKVLLANDQAQNSQNHQPPPLADPVLFVPTSTAELQTIYGDQRQPPQELYGGQQQQDNAMYTVDQQQQQQQQLFANDMSMGAMHTPELTPAAPPAVTQAQTQTQIQTQSQSEIPSQTQTQIPAQVQTPVLVAAIAAPAAVAAESDVDTPTSFQAAKRQRVGETQERRSGNGHGNVATEVATIAAATHQHASKGSTEYLRRKLGIQAARLEIESRRLDLETKREQRSSELHTVQLAMAQEQLKQARMTTQKIKSDWLVEQLIQKKRLNDAGISHEDSAALGMYLS